MVASAGAGARLGRALPKPYIPLLGRPLLSWTVEALERCDAIEHIVVVAAPDQLQRAQLAVELAGAHRVRRVVAGGASRHDSVRRGLDALPAGDALVAVHDGARPLVTPALVHRVVEAAGAADAAIPVLPVDDAVRRSGQPVPRQDLRLVQTPQVFAGALLRRAHDAADARSRAVTSDDAALVQRLGVSVREVPGEASNLKITVPDDLELARAVLLARGEDRAARVGHGYDAHPLVPGRALVLGGVELPAGRGLSGHSDADVLCHAVGDALLGAAGLGDLGAHFPASDPGLRGASSLDLLTQITALVREQRGLQPRNVDATVVCQAPRLAAHVARMAANIARALGCAPPQVNVKATTTEGLGPWGRQEGIAAHAVALLHPLHDEPAPGEPHVG